jgi:hypothetical protein
MSKYLRTAFYNEIRNFIWSDAFRRTEARSTSESEIYIWDNQKIRTYAVRIVRNMNRKNRMR